MQRKIITITALLCLGAFIYLVVRANPRELLAIIARLSPVGIFCLLLLRLLFWGIRTLCWRIVLKSCHPGRVGFFSLFCAELAGHAVGHFTPSAKLGGDAIRAMMLRSVPKNQALASVVVDKTIELIATIVMMSLGLFLTLMNIRMGSTPRVVFLSLTAAAAVAVFVFFRKQKKGLFVWILESLKRLHIRFKFLEARRERLIETDAVISDFYSTHRRSFLGGFLWYIAMLLLWAVEMHLSFYFIGFRSITLWKSFLVTMLGIVANIVPVIPAGIGIYDLSYLPIFAIFRIPLRFGITVVLLRRMLNLFLAVVGLLPMFRMRPSRPVSDEAIPPLDCSPARSLSAK